MGRFLTAVLAVIGLGAGALAQSDTSFVYQGELLDGGAPASGAHNMDFMLWDAETGGGQVGTTIQLNGVEVSGGRFAVELDFGAAAFDNSGRWVEVEVNGFTLSPRMRVTRSPYALQTRGIFVDQNERVGIGADEPDAMLHVMDGSAGSVDGHGSSSAVFERSGRNYLSLLSPSNTERGLLFGDPQTPVNGSIVFDSTRAPDGLVFRTGGNMDRMRINWLGDTIVHQRLGVGDPTNLPGQLTITDSGQGSLFAISADTSNSTYPTIFASNAMGPSVWAWGDSDVTLGGGGVVVVGADTGPNLAIDQNEIMARDGGNASPLHLNGEGGEIHMGAYDIHPALAYGIVLEDGVLFSGSSNITTVERISEGEYAFQIEGGSLPDDIVIVTCADEFALLAGVSRNGWYRVGARGHNTGDPMDADFQFVVYRP
jgi:hypothetical protein